MSEWSRTVIGISGSRSPGEVAAILSDLLPGVAFEVRESSHYGGEYYRSRGEPPEDIRLFPNFDPLDGTAYYGNGERFPLVLRLLSSPRDVDALLADLRDRVDPGCDVLVRS